MGLPLSGKSTLLDKMMWPQKVCPDDIRLAMGHEFYAPIESQVWATVETMVRAHLIRRQNVIVDATNITQHERKKWVRLANEFDYQPVAYVVPTSALDCMCRADDNNRPHMVPVIQRMREKYQTVSSKEGFEVRRLEEHA